MKRLLMTLAGMATMTAYAQADLYSTFNNDEAKLFDCCNSLPIVGPRHDNAKKSIAIPFTLQADARITEVDIAASWMSGQGNKVLVRLVGSVEGNPGRIKHKFVVGGIPKGGQCCVFETMTAHGVPVKAGGVYWIEIGVEPGDVAGWNLNSLGIEGAYKTWDGVAWNDAQGPLPAVRLLGK